MLAFGIFLILLDKILVTFDNRMTEMIVNGAISILVSFILVGGFMLVNKNMRAYLKTLFNNIKFKFGGRT